MKKPRFTAAELLAAVISVAIALYAASRIVQSLETPWRWLLAAAVAIAVYAIVYFVVVVGLVALVGTASDRLAKRDLPGERE